MTNVPGPSEPVYLAGTPIRTVLVWAPTSGHIGLSVSIFSYRGEVTVGLMVDAARIPDPDRIVTELEHELQALGRLRRTGPQRQPRRRTRSRQRRSSRGAPVRSGSRDGALGHASAAAAPHAPNSSR